MPRLVVGRPGAVLAAVDLNYFAYRLEFAPSAWGGTPCFALVYSFPPSQMVAFRPADSVQLDLRSYATVALLRAPVQFAGEAGDLVKVAAAANDSETEEVALARTTEAFTLFRNNARIRAQDVEAAAKDANEIVKVAWAIRRWMLEGAKTELKWELLNTTLVALP